MNILLACDNKIAKYVPVLITSILENQPAEHVAFYLMHSRISEENLLFIRSAVMKHKNGSLHEVVPPAHMVDCFKEVGAQWYQSRWPKECFYYLMAHTVLPIGLDRILYLDIDTIVNGDLRPLYNTDFQGKPIAVIELRTLDQVRRGHNGIPADVGMIGKERFNSGVVLINLDYFRKHVDARFYDNVIEGYRSKGKLGALFADQGVANAAFHLDAKYVDKHFHSIYDTSEDTVIFHAGGHSHKPWDIRYEDSPYPPTALGIQNWETQMNKIWWKYAALSPNYNDLITSVHNATTERLSRIIAWKANLPTQQFNQNFMAFG